jgi:hypothetical protein
MLSLLLDYSNFPDIFLNLRQSVETTLTYDRTPPKIGIRDHHAPRS